MKRLHQLFVHPETTESSVHWRVLKERVKERTGLDPFSQVDDIDVPGFKYINSQQRTTRFEIFGCDAPYTIEEADVFQMAKQLPDGAGPVEIDIAGFMLDAQPELGVLIGGMGSGKSTSLRQLAQWLRQAVDVRYLNCDQMIHDADQPPSATELLQQFMQRLLTNLIDPDEEFGACWNWAFEQYDKSDLGDRHSAVAVLGPAVKCLRMKYGRAWKTDTPQAVAFRRDELFDQVCKDLATTLQYEAMRLDYVLSVKCQGRRNAICIVLDNIDPLPPLLQRQLLLCTSQLQRNARCKVLLAMRPLTYSLTREQRATRTVKVLQHIGPPAIELIADRIMRLVDGQDLPGLSLRLPNQKGPDRELTEQDFKAWARQVLQDIRQAPASGGRNASDPNALAFVEGLCNNSLRSALLVAEKIFGSNLKVAIPAEPTAVDGAAQSTILKSHDIIRAVLLGRHAHFTSEISRVTDNLFDLGDATSSHSLTCKFRILKELATAPGRGILPLAELIDRLQAFGYSEATLLEAVNGVISQIKRLAWSDMVAVYASLHDPAGSRLSISRAGRFYVNSAVHSLEYVQEVHVDVLLPDTVCGSSYDHANFVERFNSVYRFLRHLHDVDSREVKRALTQPQSQQRYFETYGAGLFSSDIAKSLSRQVINIGNARLRRQAEGASRYATETALVAWQTMDAAFAHEDAPILSKLNSLETI